MMYVLIGIFSVLIIIVIVMSFRYSNIEMPKYTVLKSYEKNIETFLKMPFEVTILSKISARKQVLK